SLYAGTTATVRPELIGQPLAYERVEGVWGNREVPPRSQRRRGHVGETWFPPRERAEGERRSPGPLQLPVLLRIQLAAVEDPQAERNGDGADDEQRHDLVPHLGHAGAFEDRLARTLERVGRRRDRRDPLHPLRQYLDWVVDTGDHEQRALGDEAELRSLLGRDQRQHGG